MEKSFIFQHYHFDEDLGKLFLLYEYGDYSFEEILTFPKSPFHLSEIQRACLDKCLFLLHIAAGISYYKAFGNPNIQINSGVLTKKQAAFFNDFYFYGLAQFAVTNNIELSFDFPFDDKLTQEPFSLSLSNDSFVPVGGGKDSCVTMTLLKEKGVSSTTFSVNSANAIKECKRISGFDDITVQRQISPILLENKNFLNGHVPITGIIAFILLICAILYDKRYVVMSCESSANEGNFEKINHQWSKSSAFEVAFYQLTKQILPEFRYFSLLRPFTEIHIAKIFAEKCHLYFDIFTSCNHAFHIDEKKRLQHWCNNCDKCRFVFLVLAPFIDRAKLIQIFGANLLNDASQLDGFQQLLGLKGHKPFECVGTIEECRCAFELLKQKEDFKKDFIIKELFNKVNVLNFNEKLQNLMSLTPSYLIPEVFTECLKISAS